MATERRMIEPSRKPGTPGIISYGFRHTDTTCGRAEFKIFFSPTRFSRGGPNVRPNRSSSFMGDV